MLNVMYALINAKNMCLAVGKYLYLNARGKGESGNGSTAQ